MTQTMTRIDTARYARCVETSKRIRWEIDKDVIRGREFDFSKKFLPDGLSNVQALGFLSESERRLISQIQGRTYANIFGLVERFIGAKVLEVSRDYWLGDQTALEALVRFSDEELKHQELFRRVERMIAAGMPEGYAFVAEPNAVAATVLERSTWAVLALTCDIELFTQAHYKQSIAPDPELSELFKDVFLYHWREEAQHAALDELEWIREDARLTAVERDRALDDLIQLVAAVDGILQAQSAADAAYFAKIADRPVDEEETGRLAAGLLSAYRRQYIFSGVEHPHFIQALSSMITEEQGQRIQRALAPLAARGD
jgi:hypothetical protein